jgi:hypothetical protein
MVSKLCFHIQCNLYRYNPGVFGKLRDLCGGHGPHRLDHEYGMRMVGVGALFTTLFCKSKHH